MMLTIEVKKEGLGSYTECVKYDIEIRVTANSLTKVDYGKITDAILQIQSIVDPIIAADTFNKKEQEKTKNGSKK